jgi:membrane protease YdiL (CAAX protease family)
MTLPAPHRSRARVALVFYGAVVVAACALSLVASNRWPWVLPGRVPMPLPVSLAVGAAAGLGVQVLFLAAERVSERSRALSQTLSGLLGPVTPGEVMLLAGLSGVAEEVFFRGFMLPLVGLWWSSLFFGLLHWIPGPSGPVWAFAAGLAGLVLGAITLWTGDVTAAAVAHVLNNALGLWRLGRTPVHPRGWLR